MCEEGGGCYKNLTILYKLIHTPPAHKVQEVNYQEDMILILCPHGINTLSRDDHSVSGWRQKIFTQQVFWAPHFWETVHEKQQTKSLLSTKFSKFAEKKKNGILF